MDEQKNTQEVRNLKLKCNKLLDKISEMEQEITQKDQYIFELEEQLRMRDEKIAATEILIEEGMQESFKPEKKAGGEKVKRFFWKYSGLLTVLGISLGATIVLLTIYLLFF